MKRLGLRIAGKRWEARFYNNKKFAKKFGGETAAVTVPVQKRLCFPLDGLTLETIVHELTHAYLDEICLGCSVSLKKHQLEEVFAELMAKYGYVLLGQAGQLMSAYEKLKA